MSDLKFLYVTYFVERSQSEEVDGQGVGVVSILYFGSNKERTHRKVSKRYVYLYLYSHIRLRVEKMSFFSPI